MLLGLVSAIATARPHVAVTIAAIVATMAATYPTMFCGRSLVSPNNGGTAMLYNHPPFVPGSDDVVIEDRRGADVGAMMWAFVPYSQVQRDALAHSEWPLWNRHNSLGVPLWGQGQTFLLDPLHWLTLVTDDPALGWDLKFIAHRFVFACGIGMAALAATGALVPASLAAASASFAGLYVFRLNHPAVFSVTFTPWVLLGWHVLARADTWRARARGALLVTSASVLAFVASPPKEAVVGLAVAEFTGTLIVLLSRGVRAGAIRSLVAAAVAGVATILLTTPHWLVFLDTLQVSQTMYDTAALRFGGGDDAWALVLGPLTATRRPGLHLLGTVLILAALGAPQVRRQPMTIACLIGAVSALAIMYGVIPADWLMKIPLVANISGIDNDISTATLGLLLIVSASGAQAILSGSRPSIVIATAGIVFVGAWIVVVDPAVVGTNPFERWVVGAAIAVAAFVPVAMAACRVALPTPMVAVAGVLVTMLLFPGGQHVETGITALDGVLQQPRPRTSLASRSPSVRAFHMLDGMPTRVSGVDNFLYAGTYALYGLEGTGGPDALFLRATGELLDMPDSSVRVGWVRYFASSSLDRDATLLDMLNVGYLLAPKDRQPPGTSPEGAYDDDRLQLFRRPTAWPRAYFVNGVGTYTTPNDLLAQARAAGRPIAAVQIDDRDASDLPRVSNGQATVVQAADRYVLTSNVTAFRLHATGEGVAVLTESYVPGDFIATLNGQAVPYFRVNHALKGIGIPRAGDWDVRFEYRPRRWDLALQVSAFGAALVVAMATLPLLPRPS